MSKKSTRSAPRPTRAAQPKPDRAVGNQGGVAVPKPNMPMNLPGMPNRPKSK
jgi:hypothetical protein